MTCAGSESVAIGLSTKRNGPMRVAIKFCFLMAVVIVTAKSATAEDRANSLIVTGRIWTGAPAQPWAEAVGIEGERIVAVGPRAEVVERVGEDAPVIDAGDGLVVPGMCDAHIHLISGGEHLASVQLRDAKSRKEFVARIGDFVKTERAEGQWITGATGITRSGVANHLIELGSMPSPVMCRCGFRVLMGIWPSPTPPRSKLLV